jgi:ATP-dependent helicase/nuclease subunit B
MATRREGPRVFTIPAGVPFLPTLADALLAGELVPVPTDDPLGLAAVTILLPTRRSVRALGELLVERLGREAAILPIIRPIGDIDEEDHLLDSSASLSADPLVLPPAITPLARRLALTRLTLAWGKGLRIHSLGLKADEPLLIPASAADAARLAGDLARLIDDMQTAGVPGDALATLAPEDHAEYFQFTLEFLKIVTQQWPTHLLERGMVDPAARRDQLIRAAAGRVRGPIVAAGSTGSIPATAVLLSAIARLADGAVVLPGLDQDLDAAGWNAIGDPIAVKAATYGHPQFGLKQLIGEIGIAREEVTPLRAATASARSRLLSQAIRPAETLDAWAGVRPDTGALAGVDLLVARNEQEEATAIALAIRDAIETPDTTAALVTPDRTIARRVAAELGRWGLSIDDSAGARLDREPHGIFARLVAEAAASDGDPVKLLALLKHPLAVFGMAKPLCRQAARTLELALFRGHRVPGGVARLAGALAEARELAKTDRHAPASRRRLSESDWRLAAALVERIGACLGPLEAACRKEIAASAAVDLLAGALASSATDESGNVDALQVGAGGQALSTLLDEIANDSEAASLPLAPGDLPFFLAALLADVTVQRLVGADPRIHIWGALEARLQSVDLLILGGLDEGVWPTETRTDPWLSRSMRAAIKLPPPERRLGLAAHDFFQGLAAPRVIVTRAEKRGGAPTVESRWLQRLRALIGKDAAVELAGRGERYLEWARTIDAVPKEAVVPINRPAPKPPIAARPTSLSITEIETLIRDPYAIYARRILNLEQLEPLGRPPDGGLRGNLVHEALSLFTKEWRVAFDATAEARLNAIAADVLREVEDFPDVHAVWSLRLNAIARWLVGFEAERDARVVLRHAEIDGTLPVTPTFTLRGRADRVDVMRDGTIAIYDYKTSTPQTDRSVFAGLTPQMALEAAMAKAGGFPGVTGGGVSELAWLAVGRIGREQPYQSAVLRNQTPDGLAADALRHLVELMTKFADVNHPYQSRTRPRMENTRYVGDYDHLARVREWALVESLEDVAMMGGPSP